MDDAVAISVPALSRLDTIPIVPDLAVILLKSGGDEGRLQGTGQSPAA